MSDTTKGRFEPGDDPRREATKFREGNNECITHAGYRYLKTGEMPDEHKDIQDYLDGLRAEMVNDLGGESLITSGQNIILDQIIKLSGFCALVERHVLRTGAIIEIKNKAGEVSDLKMSGPLNGFYLAAMNTIKRNIELLKLHEPRSFERASEFEQFIAREGKDETEKD